MKYDQTEFPCFEMMFDYQKSIIVDQRILMHEFSQSPYSSILSLQGYCNICFNNYNQQDRKPLFICRNDHSVCKQCLLIIKQDRLRCPFCRQNVRLDRIRLNNSAAELVRLRSAEVSARGNASQIISQVEERSERQEQHGQIQYAITQRQPYRLYLNESQFTSSAESSILSASYSVQRRQINNNGNCEKFWDVLTFFNVLVLQLPISIFNFMVSVKYSGKGCFDCSLPQSSFSLQSYWSTVGFMELIIPTLGLYFLIVHLTAGVLDQMGMRIFEALLTLIIEIKSVLSFIFYMKLLRSQMIWLYSRFIVDSLVVNLYINCFSLLLGIFLLARQWEILFGN